VTPKCSCNDFAFSTWSSPYGTGTSSSYSAGSFTFFTQTFKPVPRPHR
jgi:hypothetical protein